MARRSRHLSMCKERQCLRPKGWRARVSQGRHRHEHEKMQTHRSQRRWHRQMSLALSSAPCATSHTCRSGVDAEVAWQVAVQTTLAALPTAYTGFPRIEGDYRVFRLSRTDLHLFYYHFFLGKTQGSYLNEILNSCLLKDF